MTREEAEKLLPFMQAYVEGKTIQQRRQVGYEDEWFDVNRPLWDESPSNYRIKPEPTYRPFKNQEECWNEMLKHRPFGWLKTKNKENAILIGNVFDIWIIFATEETEKFHSISNVFDNYVFADGSPFGIKEN